jgi:tripeptidyl-peptidase I
VKHDYAITFIILSSEGACETVIYSGGGFSNIFPLPDYQANAVGFYYQYYTPDKYNLRQYNDSQKARGFPDISANGTNYVITVDSQLGLVYGTSASSPVFGAIITIISNERIAASKGPVRFLNPTLYAFPSALNDITLDWNQGCGTQGFRAVKGWDPLTGLGTPNYPKLLEVFLHCLRRFKE